MTRETPTPTPTPTGTAEPTHESTSDALEDEEPPHPTRPRPARESSRIRNEKNLARHIVIQLPFPATLAFEPVESYIFGRPVQDNIFAQFNGVQYRGQAVSF